MANGAHEKSFAMVIAELKLEFSEFIQTRYQMFTSEVAFKIRALKLAAPMMLAALVLCGIGFLLFTAALVAVIAIGLGGAIGAWALALVIVGASYFVLGGIAGVFGWRQITSQGLAPKRTLKVLKQDQIWLQNEARSQL